MATASDRPSDRIKRHRQSFAIPRDFHRTTDPPCPTQDNVTDTFILRRDDNVPKGYIVVKLLQANGGDLFWSVEEYRNNGRYQKQMNSYGTTDKDAVPEHISNAAANIRNHEIP